MGGACLHMPQDGHWLASFEVIPLQKLAFPRPKIGSSPLKTADSAMNFQAKMLAFLFWRKLCHAILDSREQQAIPPN